MFGQIRTDRGKSPRDLVVPLQLEALHQGSAIKSFVRMVAEAIEQSAR